jgi:hypothetical protein
MIVHHYKCTKSHTIAYFRATNAVIFISIKICEYKLKTTLRSQISPDTVKFQQDWPWSWECSSVVMTGFKPITKKLKDKKGFAHHGFVENTYSHSCCYKFNLSTLHGKTYNPGALFLRTDVINITRYRLCIAYFCW